MGGRPPRANAGSNEAGEGLAWAQSEHLCGAAGVPPRTRSAARGQGGRRSGFSVQVPQKAVWPSMLLPLIFARTVLF